MTIERSNSDIPSNIVAPFTSALFKAGSPSSLLELIGEMRGVSISFNQNIIEGGTRMRADPIIKSLYVIEQPITFRRTDGRVCFMAPVYSPVPVPEQILSCDLN